MYKTVNYDIGLHVKRAANLSSIELEMYKPYMDELRAKRAIWTRNVQHCVKLWYARAANLKLGMYKAVWNYDMQNDQC